MCLFDRREAGLRALARDHEISRIRRGCARIRDEKAAVYRVAIREGMVHASGFEIQRCIGRRNKRINSCIAGYGSIRKGKDLEIGRHLRGDRNFAADKLPSASPGRWDGRDGRGTEVLTQALIVEEEKSPAPAYRAPSRGAELITLEWRYLGTIEEISSVQSAIP